MKMGIIFGKKKQVSRISEQDKAVLQLKQQRDKLRQYQRRIELSLVSDREIAKRLLNEGKKDRAKLLLRKKRYQEQLLQNTDGQMEHLERMTHDIEFAQIEIQVVEGLKKGNEALMKVNQILSLEDIENVLEESKAGIEKQREIDALISGALTEDDEIAVEEELNDMIQKSLPSVPVEAVDEEMLPETSDSPMKEKLKKKTMKEAVAMEA